MGKHLPSLLVVFISIILLQTSCDGLNEILGEEEVPDTYLNTSNYNTVPFEIITLTSEEGLPANDEFTGKIGDIEITAVQSEPGILYVMIPDIETGSYNLSVNLGDFDGYTEIVVESAPQLTNPEEIVENVIAIANQSLTDLGIIENQTGQKLDEQVKTLLNNVISEMNNVYSTLSQSEKQKFAAFIMANPELFGLNSSKSMNSGEYLEGFRDFMKQNMLKVMIAGGSFYLSFTAPEPTGVTKIIALASAAYLVKKILELGMKVLEIYDANVVAEQSGLTVIRSEMVFLNHEEIMFDVKVTYRTIYKEDISTSNSILAEVISIIHKYLDYRNKVDGYIIQFKSIFNIGGGGLGSGPKRVSEIESTTSEEIDSVVQQMIADNDISVTNAKKILSS